MLRITKKPNDLPYRLFFSPIKRYRNPSTPHYNIPYSEEISGGGKNEEIFCFYPSPTRHFPYHRTNTKGKEEGEKRKKKRIPHHHLTYLTSPFRPGTYLPAARYLLLSTTITPSSTILTSVHRSSPTHPSIHPPTRFWSAQSDRRSSSGKAKTPSPQLYNPIAGSPKPLIIPVTNFRALPLEESEKRIGALECFKRFQLEKINSRPP